MKYTLSSGVWAFVFCLGSLPLLHSQPAATATALTLAGYELDAVNSFAEPRKIAPVASTVAIKRRVLRTEVEVPPRAFAVYRVNIQ